MADWALLAGFGSLGAGGLLDLYLLWQWANGDTQSLALGAVAQTLVVSGLSLLVMAVLIGVLRSESMAMASRAERARQHQQSD